MEPPPQRKMLSASGWPSPQAPLQRLRKIDLPGTSGKEPGTAADLVAGEVRIRGGPASRGKKERLD